ncbi:MAG: RelA/SpoT family protein [Candidatus Wolfebacteria bacterium]|nr:RelA/SpoT family protein [Candidatus Wolfebacteria bacterium]
MDDFLEKFKKYAAAPNKNDASTLSFVSRVFKFRNGAVVDPQSVDLVRRAYEFAKMAHADQKRKSGESYFKHPYETALKLIEWRLDTPTIMAGLLHDVAEDTSVGLDNIKKEFGEEIAFLVEGVTKLGYLKYRGVESQAENLRKMILALSQDLRVVLIKLADRLHNMKTLKALPPQKQKRIALETYEIYAPLAYRLGMQGLAGELEDLAFPYIYPNEHRWLMDNVKDRYEKRQKYLKGLEPVIEKALEEDGIKILKIDYRAKRYSSLYKKLKRYDMNLDQVYDLVAMRIIVETIEDCYGALGTIHKLWPPLPGRIKDYIALPKPNGYRSLHTTVFCEDNRPTEFQIRTMQMHEESENGIAAHWAYEEEKETSGYVRRRPVFADKRELAWVNQLRDWQKEVPDSQEFLDSLKIDFFRDRIFVITPKGAVIDLPEGSTPVDFAYHIHSEIGDQCSGCRINGKITPLDYNLQSGDVVEILIQKSKKPSESWLRTVKTEAARKKIRSSIVDKRKSLGKGKK